MSNNNVNEKEIVSFLQAEVDGLVWVGLFGSAVTEYFEKYKSDVDIAFISENKISNIKRWEIQEALASKLNSDIDLVDLDKSNDVISFEILSKGKNIFKKDSHKLEIFLDKIYINYIQLNEDRKEIVEMYA